LQGGDELNSENVQTELSFAFDKILSFAFDKILSFAFDKILSFAFDKILSFAFDKILSFAYMSSSLGKPRLLRRGGCH